MKFGFRVPKSTDNIYGYKSINFKDIDLTKPVILAFCGGSTIRDKDANFMGRFVERLLGVQVGEFINIYSAKYNNEDILVNDEDYAEMLDSFSELVFDKNGEPLSIIDAKKNMRNINIVSFCFGAWVVEKTATALYKRMVKNGYTENDSKQILKQIFHLSYAPNIRSGSYGLRLTNNILCKDIQDATAGINDTEFFQLFEKPLIFQRDKQYINAKDFIKSKIVDNNLIFYVNHIFEHLEDYNTHNLTHLEKNKNFHIENNYRAEILSMVMSDVLSFAVINSINNYNGISFQELENLNFFESFIMDKINRDQSGIRDKKFKKSFNEYANKINYGKLSIVDYMNKNGISEVDLVNGKLDWNMSKCDLENLYYLDFNNTNLALDYFEEPKIINVNDDFLKNSYILLENDYNLYPSLSSDYMPTSIQLKTHNKKLQNSIQINLKINDDGSKYFYICPNYGAFDGDKEYNSIKELISIWHENYDNKKSYGKIKLSSMQKKMLLNFLEKHNGIDIKYDSRILVDKNTTLQTIEKK